MNAKNPTWDIFVVDADQKTRQELKLIAAACGYSVQTFSNATSALLAIKDSLPRLVITELLLPGMDGFELCQAIRTELMYTDLPILCTTAISWGSVDLPALLQRRFSARYLEKGVLGSRFIITLNDILGGPANGQAPADPAPSKAKAPNAREVSDTDDTEALVDDELENLCLGLEEVLKTQDLTRQFEEEIANIEVSQVRQKVRVQAEFQVYFKNITELVNEYTNNISCGGLFIKAESPPEIDAVIDLSLRIPQVDRPIEVKARVVHRVTATEAEVLGCAPGFGAEFINLSLRDRSLLEKLVQEVRLLQSTVKEPDPPDILWLVLIGLPMLPIVGRPNFLLRQNIRVVEFPDLSVAEDFLVNHHSNLVIVGEHAFDFKEAERHMQRLNRLLDKKTERMVMLNQMRDLPEVLSQGLCHVVVDTSLTMENLLEELSLRLGVRKRRHLRVPHHASVAIRSSTNEFMATMVNLSCSGMLIQSPSQLNLGTTLQVRFDLPEAPGLCCRVVVVRKTMEAERSEISYGLMFEEYFGRSEGEIKKFVQKHVNFREFFRWMKKRFFEWP